MPDRDGDYEPFLVPEGWVRSVMVTESGHASYRLLFYDDGGVRFEHRCNRGERGTVICAPALQLGHGHLIGPSDPVTVTPSILCPDCGTHGFITDGRWISA